MMIGERLLKYSDNYRIAIQILNMFEFELSDSKNINIHNAERLVELNNEVYEKLNKDCAKCNYYNYSTDEYPCDRCYQQAEDKFEAPETS